MTFLELKKHLLGTPTEPGTAFPLGTPDNLRPQIEQMVVEAMIEVQREVECWQKGHCDVRPARSLMQQNRVTVLDMPRGEITRIFTVEADDSGWETPVHYFPVELQQLRRWAAKYRTWTASVYESPLTSTPDQEGMRPTIAADDSKLGRAMTGIWAKDWRTNRLHVAPWLQSNELLVIEWTGIKRTWSDSDIVSDEPDFIRLVKLWVLQEYGRHWAADDLSVRVQTWADAQADAIVDCEGVKRNVTTQPSAEEVDESFRKYKAVPPAVPATPREETIVCVVGDSGTAGADAQAVADAITLDKPDLVVIAGDAVYQPNTPAQALAPYQSFIDDGRLVVSLGNHDLDVNNGADVVEFVRNPGNGRYFNIAIGPVEFFVLNDGINTAGDIVEDDGNFQGSIQSSLIESLIARSCAWWKFAVVHHPGYTSGSQYWPGIADNRWISDLEVHGVLSAHTHAYERGTWRNRKHVIVGTGGQTLHTFTTPVSGSEVRISQFGYLRITATSKTCLLEFVSTAGTVLDSFSLTGDPPMRSSLPPETETTAFNDVIQAGATYATVFFIRDVNGAAVDLTGCTAVLQLRRLVGAPDPPDLELSTGSGITITGATGRIDVVMTPVQTGALSGVYVYAMEVTYPNTTVERPIEGTFTISPEIVL